MSGGMNHRPEGHGICHLSMEPDVFIGREQPSKLGTNDTDDVSEHWEEDEASVIGENKASATGGPNGELEAVQSVELLVGFLRRCK
jgi:hypothetical protein